MLPRATQYAIRAMVFLAAQPPGQLRGAQEISIAEHIPKPFLWKVLYKLQSKSLLRSFRGIGGGYELARPARSIYLNQVLSATGASPILHGCVLGFSECPQRKLCPVQPACAQLRKDVRKLFRQCTIADFAALPRNSGSRH
ncbi:MAG TPA: Rrf2 family transcriptional regulator [Terriglobales bacterium]|nr:Rrf2 family transcriptional regulator [Terriglobales bacterium]